MTKVRTAYRCKTCGATAPRWTGRCPGCGEWNCLVEEFQPATAARSLVHLAARASGAPMDVPVALDAIDPDLASPRSTGLDEFDRVLGGGLVPGSVTLLGGEPGVGKSTLLLQALLSVSRDGPVLLVAAEESAQQVRLRAQRLGGSTGSLSVLPTTELSSAISAVSEIRPILVVVDSVQTISDLSVSAPAGSLVQVRSCADSLVSMAKSMNVPFVLVSHVTKDGNLAGPRALEHLVDTVLSVEGDRHHALRTLRAVKHRYGATGEIGLFELNGDGMRPVADPHTYLLGDRRAGVPGSIVMPAVEGQRALLVELQVLMAPARSSPRVMSQGLDAGRLALVRCVLERRFGVGGEPSDVFASAVGGLRVTEPAADLAVALALLSADFEVAVPETLVAFGEVGLAGEVRQVRHARARLVEAARAGFTTAIVPDASPDGPPGLELIRARSVADAMRGLMPRAPAVA